MDNQLEKLKAVLLKNNWITPGDWEECLALSKSIKSQAPLVDLLYQFKYIETPIYRHLKEKTRPSTSGESERKRSSKFFQRGGLAKYHIEKELGAGGMGKVYLAYDKDLQRKTALKVCTQTDDQHRARFVREARIGCQLDHPNIAPVYDAGQGGNDTIYFTMKYIEGVPFSTVLEQLANSNPAFEKNYPLQGRLQIFSKVLEGMGYAHAKGIIHRDLKPENIMIGRFGEVWIVDWGLAKKFKEKSQNPGQSQEINFGEYKTMVSAKTVDGAIAGTPGYMAPEQALGDLDLLSPSSDIFALGIVLYEILTLKPTFVGGDPIQVLFKIVKSDFQPPRKRAPHRQIPPALEAICLKAMAREQKDRYQTAESMLKDLQNYLDDQPISVYTPPLGIRFMSFVRRHSAAVLVGSFICLLLAFFAFFLAQAREKQLHQERQKKLALEEKNRILDQKRKLEREKAEERKKREKRLEKRAQAMSHYLEARDYLSRNIKFDVLKKVVIPKLKKALEIHEDLLEARVELIKIYFYLERNDAGIGQMIKLAQTLSKNKKAKINRLLPGILFLQQNKQKVPQYLLKNLEQWGEWKPEFLPESYWKILKAIIFLNIREFDEALKIVNNILDSPGGMNWENLYFKGKILVRKGELKRAQKIFRQICVQYPEIPHPYLDRININYDQKNYGKVRDLCQVLIRKDPTCHSLWLILAKLNMRFGNKKLSLSLRKAEEFRIYFYLKALNFFERTFHFEKDFKLALPFYKSCIEKLAFYLGSLQDHYSLKTEMKWPWKRPLKKSPHFPELRRKMKKIGFRVKNSRLSPLERGYRWKMTEKGGKNRHILLLKEGTLKIYRAPNLSQKKLLGIFYNASSIDKLYRRLTAFKNEKYIRQFGLFAFYSGTEKKLSSPLKEHLQNYYIPLFERALENYFQKTPPATHRYWIEEILGKVTGANRIGLANRMKRGNYQAAFDLAQRLKKKGVHDGWLKERLTLLNHVVNHGSLAEKIHQNYAAFKEKKLAGNQLLPLLLRALKNHPQDIYYHYCLIEVYLGMGLTSKGLAAVHRALKVENIDKWPSLKGGILYQLGKLLYFQGKFSKAKKALHQSIAARPHLSAPYTWLGLMAQKKGQYNKALKEYKKGWDLLPKNEGLAVRIGGLLAERNKYEDLEDFTDRALSYFPSRPDLLKWNIVAKKELKKYGEMARSASRAFLKNPQQGEFLLYQMEGLYREGNFKELEKLCQKQIARFPSFCELRYWRGRLYQTRGEKKKARRDFAHVRDRTTSARWKKAARQAIADLDKEKKD